MIGRLRFEWQGTPCSAELSDDLRWSVESAEREPKAASLACLELFFDPREDLRPSDGTPGFKAFREAADFLEASIENLARPGGDPDVLY